MCPCHVYKRIFQIDLTLEGNLEMYFLKKFLSVALVHDSPKIWSFFIRRAQCDNMIFR